MARRGRPSSPAAASLPDNDDLLSDILLRLPPAPSSLSCATLVCKRWRRLVTNPPSSAASAPATAAALPSSVSSAMGCTIVASCSR
ncbi:unnamed protein product [Urochloa humidicola]